MEQPALIVAAASPFLPTTAPPSPPPLLSSLTSSLALSSLMLQWQHPPPLSHPTSPCQIQGFPLLILALQKLLINARMDSNMLAKNLLRAAFHAIGICLGLDRHMSLNLIMSRETELKWDLFEANITEMRTDTWY
jgi:hypothetical protein